MSTSGQSGWVGRVMVATAVVVLPASVAVAAAPDAAVVAAPPPPTTMTTTTTSPPVSVAPAVPPTSAVPVTVPPVPEAAPAVELVDDAACGGLLRLAGTELCSHGADPEPSFADAPPPPPPGSAASAGGAPTCDDGRSGLRVQAVYAVPAGARARLGEVAGRIRSAAAAVDQIVRDSSAGTRSVRWALDGSCRVAIAQVSVSASARDSFAATIQDLTVAGFDRRDRRYLIWFDAATLCGIATMWADDRSTPANANNGSRLAYGRVDVPCWGGPTEAHELTHMLGGVQGSAPHATRGGHCTDESDVLCYADGPGVRTSAACPAAAERLLDCNGDDYFNVRPAPGSYLATHWNVASSSFLHGAPPRPPAAELRFEGRLTNEQPAQRVTFDAGAGPVTVHLEHPAGTSTNLVTNAVATVATGSSAPARWTVRVLDGSGRVHAAATGTTGTVDLRLSVPLVGRYELDIAADGIGAWSAAVVAPWA